MNGAALVAIYKHLKDLDQEVIDGIDTLLSTGANFLPAKVQAFAKEAEVGLKIFLALDPLVQELEKLLPAA